MTARKKVQPEPAPVTVAELLLALASYPQDAPLWTCENGTGGGEVWVDVDPSDTSAESNMCIWEGHAYERPAHRAEEIVKVVRRAEPMDDFAAAKEFLEWLQAQHYGMPKVSTGGGQNEPTTYRDLTPAELAEEFARRQA